MIFEFLWSINFTISLFIKKLIFRGDLKKINHTTPCAIMASATFTKPPMLAPLR